ncbi:hypothetical protein BDV26DRAFT_295767 [Aspergillus bertholletiae]|uniref:Restriction endonuclease domain-containing protein n=1 Tax=Aspergillus bertholletiae TaxID=1226010 RepID=A0A5N7AXP8_9EURO|nr:hypothetical protein BDV26DRAFT_295767 [Aspergillus bertholletiae]
MSAENQSSESSIAPSAPSAFQVPSASPGRVLRSQKSKTPLPPTGQQLFYILKQNLLQTNGPGFIEWRDTPPLIGCTVAKSLSEDPQVERRSVRISHNPINQTLMLKMPSHTHEVILKWASNELFCAGITGFFTMADLNDISLSASCRFDNRPTSFYKEPDVVFVYGPGELPTVVVEVGYSQAWPSLLEDRNMWFKSAATVNVVILVKWNKRAQNKVAGYLEIFRRGAPAPTHIDIFPQPITPQTFTLHRGDFYPPGTALPPGRNPNDLWTWDTNNLRIRATRAINVDDMVPA